MPPKVDRILSLTARLVKDIISNSALAQWYAVEILPWRYEEFASRSVPVSLAR
jgi:hypothetical protein